jgi:hypothetical protein
VDTLDVAKVCVRRWYVFALLLLLAMYAGLSLTAERKPVYMATGNFAVIYRAPSNLKPTDPDPRQENPLAAGGGQLLKQSIVNDLQSANSQRELAPPTTSGTSPSDPPDGSRFALTTTRDSATVTVTAFSQDEATVQQTVDRVLSMAAKRAKAIQDSVGAPAPSRLATFVTLPTQTTVLPPPSRMKLIIGVMAVGAIAGAGLSLLIDRLLTKRQEGLDRREKPSVWRRLRRRRRNADEHLGPVTTSPHFIMKVDDLPPAPDTLAGRGSPTGRESLTRR